MIDTHCHLLPGVDDGAADWEMALAMARTAAGDGITQSVLTPHWTGVAGETERVRARLEEFRTRLAEEGIPLRIHPGNEVILVPRLVEALGEGEALTLGGSSYVLLETAQLERGAFIHPALFQIQSSGYRIILAHPERVRGWQHDVGDLRGLVERGCFLQVNAGSLRGDFGKDAKKAAERFLRLGWVSLLASDSHNPDARPPLLSDALQRCAEILGDERARALVEKNPLRVLCNEQLPYIDPEAPEIRPRFSFPWWPRR